MMRRTSPFVLAAGLACTALAGCEQMFMDGTAAPATEPATMLVATPAAPAGGKLTPAKMVQLIALTDEAVLAQALEADIARQGVFAADGAFEPEFYAEANRNRERRETTALQLSSAVGGPDPFWSFSHDGRLGVKMKSRTGVNVDLYYDMQRVSNSLQASAALPLVENTAKSGISLQVPLLRNAGREVNTSGIRIAQIEQDIAQETSKLVKAKRAYEGLRTYVAYQRAEARVATRGDLLALSQRLVREMQGQLGSGLTDPRDLTEAQGNVAEARAALLQAQAELAEQRDALQIYFVGLPSKTASEMWLPAGSLSAVDGRRLGALSSLDTVYARRPEIRIQGLQIERREVERLVAENATKSELNLNLDFAKTKVSGDYMPFRELFSNANPNQTWRVGFEFRRGLGGNRTAQAELKAAELREEQAELTMNAFRQRLAGEINAIDGILTRARLAVSENQKFLAAQGRLVRDENDRARTGLSTQVDVVSRRIQEVLTREARNDAIAQLNQAYYLAAYANGTLLDVFGVN
ncbi:TolC family protein [Sagittula salina]|uniref:TolC family protein n=1 Tax=Sagittula salina TaxID=2820268 RepID=A0A940MX02_9RHOB|nr:TolC family protein [Sagittula salina]MBP0484424.1 TolC family protein [Sagittula salina]